MYIITPHFSVLLMLFIHGELNAFLRRVIALTYEPMLHRHIPLVFGDCHDSTTSTVVLSFLKPYWFSKSPPFWIRTSSVLFFNKFSMIFAGILSRPIGLNVAAFSYFLLDFLEWVNTSPFSTVRQFRCNFPKYLPVPYIYFFLWRQRFLPPYLSMFDYFSSFFLLK